MTYTHHIPPDLPTCPECQMHMRLTRIVPRMVQKEDEPETKPLNAQSATLGFGPLLKACPRTDRDGLASSVIGPVDRRGRGHQNSDDGRRGFYSRPK